MSYGIRLFVNSDYACFTRPEMKVERVSYDVMTPSAARGVLEAIYWKPQIRWVVKAIHVLKPIRFSNIRRNEVSDKASRPTAAHMAGQVSGNLGVIIEDKRQQRASTLLREVAYVIEADFDILDYRFERNGPEMSLNDCAGKHLDMFKRRARVGQCFHRPYLGCREFSADFELIEDDSPLPASELPESDRNRRLGWMLHDIDFRPATKKDRDSFVESSQGRRVRAEPRFFDAVLADGVLRVPPLIEAKA